MTVDTKEIEVFKSEASQLEKNANELSITSPEENAIAIELKAKLKSTLKNVESRKEEITKPLNEALKSARALFAPIEDMFKNADTIVGRKLLAYKQKVEEENRKKEAAIAARVEKGTMKIETAAKKIDALPQTQKTINTTAGQVQFRKIPQMRITNESLIPDKYWVIDEVALRRDVIAGEIVPGAEKYFEERV